ncbi:hypothetical protein AOLI_G00166320 [Acnodon oligacanthus]
MNINELSSVPSPHHPNQREPDRCWFERIGSARPRLIFVLIPDATSGAPYPVLGSVPKARGRSRFSPRSRRAVLRMRQCGRFCFADPETHRSHWRRCGRRRRWVFSLGRGTERISSLETLCSTEEFLCKISAKTVWRIRPRPIYCTMTSSSTPRMHTYKRTSSPRSPTNTGELFTSAHEENVRFIHDTWQCVLRDIKSPQNSERGPQEYVEKNPNPNLHSFTPVDLSDLKKRNTQDSKKS